MVEAISNLISSFLARYTKLQLQLLATVVQSISIEERVDLALRVRVATHQRRGALMRSRSSTSTGILVKAFTAGADDFVAKPFSSAELLALMRILSNRPTPRPCNRSGANGSWAAPPSFAEQPAHDRYRRGDCDDPLRPRF